MTCFQAKAYIRLFATGGNRGRALQHAVQCLKCRSTLEPDLVLQKLMTVRESSDETLSPELYRQVTAKINRELTLQTSARRLLSTTWESTVLQLQSWVYAGSFAALLVFGLVFYSGELASQTVTSRDILSDAMISQQTDSLVLTRTDPLSQDDALFALLSEDIENVRK